jgi:hypothetical protein
MEEEKYKRPIIIARVKDRPDEPYLFTYFLRDFTPVTEAKEPSPEE